VFVGLPEALRKYEERGSFAAWLRRITVRVALSRIRAARAHEALHDVPAARHDPLDRMAIDHALAALTPALRAVVVLREVEGYSHAEIGSMLGISRAASEVRLHRALRLMRRHLTEEE
jgi:RNA polymerase sigma-70 factor (ECF subfamily)